MPSALGTRPAAVPSMHFGGPVATSLLARDKQEPPLHLWVAKFQPSHGETLRKGRGHPMLWVSGMLPHVPAGSTQGPSGARWNAEKREQKAAPSQRSPAGLQGDAWDTFGRMKKKIEYYLFSREMKLLSLNFEPWWCFFPQRFCSCIFVLTSLLFFLFYFFYFF